MVAWARTELTGWGRVARASTLAARPERIAEIERALAEAHDSTLLAFGAGRSYGDTALNSGGKTLLMQRLDRFLEFDADSGVLVCEPGVTFIDVIRTFLPLGFMVPVVPGTGFATLGGAVANDVHGKNHHQAGSFGHHVEWMDLRLPTGELRRVSHSLEPELFAATVGGVGLTGIIERVCVRLVRVPSNSVMLRKRRIRDLDEFLDAFDQERDRSPYVVGWIDALASGRALGRGILETASPAERNVRSAARRARRVPIDFPGFVLNGYSVRAFNFLYRRHVGANGFEGHATYEQFLFPLDAVHDWNRIYGKRGFRQFQCVVPFENGRAALVKILSSIAKANRGSFLAVLKAMGASGVGCLSFPMPGYTLALDFPNAPGVVDFIQQLERITSDYGGRVYLAKDSTLSPAVFRQMYPRAGEFVSVLERIDPGQRMRSDMAVRLGLRAASRG